MADVLITPVVNVITPSTDWPAIVAAIVAGVAAVVGIIGTYWQAKRAREDASQDLRASLDAASANLLASITAEDKRAERAVKQRAYAECHVSFLTMMTAVLRQRTERLDSLANPDVEKAMAIVAEPRVAMYNSVSEVRLVAPVEIGNLAADIQADFLTFIEETRAGAPHPSGPPALADMQEQLYNLMRADLGVSTPGPDVSPVQTTRRSRGL